MPFRFFFFCYTELCVGGKSSYTSNSHIDENKRNLQISTEVILVFQLSQTFPPFNYCMKSYSLCSQYNMRRKPQKRTHTKNEMNRKLLYLLFYFFAHTKSKNKLCDFNGNGERGKRKKMFSSGIENLLFEALLPFLSFLQARSKRGFNLHAFSGTHCCDGKVTNDENDKYNSIYSFDW